MQVIETIECALLWSAIINMGVLLWWFLFFCFAHDWMYRLHTRWFRLSVETFDAVHYGGMAAYKLGIFLLNIMPYVALRIAA